MASTSWGWATTQTSPPSRRASRQPARGPGQVALGELPRALEREVDRPDRQVLDHLLVAGDRRVDREREDLPLAVGGAAAEPAARLAHDGLEGELLAHPRDLALDA